MRTLNHHQKLFFLFIALFFFSCPVFAQQSYPAIVLKITDGDTVWVLMAGQRLKLRLLGIDTPEKFASRKLDRDAERCGVPLAYMKHLGQAATHYAKNCCEREKGSKSPSTVVDITADNKILAITKDDDYLENTAKQAKVREYEKQIDQFVYKLYGLTAEEIKIVENSDKK